MDIPEKQQAEALQRVAALGAARTKALAEVDRLTTELKAAAVDAAKLGATRTRIRDLAEVNATTLYPWLKAGGVAIQPPRRPRKAA